jgi:hypothetical protein
MWDGIQGVAMKIGELAKTAQTQTETIRYYEREGLLPEAARTDANYRISHVATRIRELKALEKDLKLLREQCASGGAGDCGILSGLEKAALQQSRNRAPPEKGHAAHIHGTHPQVGGPAKEGRTPPAKKV